MMTPETIQYFETLEPLVQATMLVDKERVTDFTQLGPVSHATLVEFTRLYRRMPHRGMHQAIETIWVTFTGKRLIYLLDRPVYKSFEFVVDGDRVFADIVTENCGRYQETFTLKGKAQRLYLCNVLGTINVNTRVLDWHERDFVFSFDGTHLNLNTLSHEKVTA